MTETKPEADGTLQDASEAPSKKPAARKPRKRAPAKKKGAARKRAPAKGRKGAGRGTTRRAAGGHLVIVESPTKAKTLNRYLAPVLGGAVTVKASYGHVRDLPESKLGVDTEKAFEPTYEVLSGSRKVVSELRSAAKGKEQVWLATDLDREGEAIAWHVCHAIGMANGQVDERVRRVVFPEITPEAIEQAFRHPRGIDLHLVDAQQARRVLDRLVGYKLSPLLWKKVRPGLSAGRVQSVALRLVVDREREIQAFTPVEYWTIEVPFETERDERFTSSLHSVAGRKIEISNEEEASAHAEAIRAAGTYEVSAVRRREQKQNPPRPFITSTLQQESARKLSFSARKTMVLAQQLYEGVELGPEGQVGLITYMRTDSVHLAPGAVQEIRTAIQERYGEQYLPAKPRVYRSKKGAQEAHEAIRPTHAARHPEAVQRYLEPDQLKLYRLIWERTIACQMTEALFDATSVDILAGGFGGQRSEAEPPREARQPPEQTGSARERATDQSRSARERATGDYLLRATGRVMLFDGFLVVYREGRDDEDEEVEGRLPELTEGQPLRLVDVIPSQHFTQPPPRYTEASLVKALEEHGIGRPSTYAPTLSTLVDREYVRVDQRRLFPTDVGMVVTDLLVEHFPQVVDLKFTATIEEDLDEIARGHKDWPEVLRQFYDPFERLLEKKDKEITRDDVIKETTEEKCPECGSPMTVKLGRYGKFLSCSRYPDCKGTRQIDGSQRPEPQVVPGEMCEECGSPMLLKHGRYGEFLGCSRYPECKFVRSKTIGGKCPKCGEGKLAQRRTRRGKSFYGCTRYPECDYALWTRPLDDPCPKCGGTMTPDEERGGVCLSCGHVAGPSEATASSPGQASSG